MVKETLQNLPTPDRKVTAGLLAGAIIAVVAWTVSVLTDVVIPAEIALAANTIVLFGLQYVVPNK